MGTNGEVYEKIKLILSQTFKVDIALIQEGANIKDILGLDSVDLMDAICLLEEEFKIEIFKGVSDSVHIPETVGDLVGLVDVKLKKKKSGD